MTAIVWVLLLTPCSYGSCAPLIIDNIASQGNCEAVARIIDAQATHRCIAVRKAVLSKPQVEGAGR